MNDENYNIALLIDTENVSARYMSALEKELIILGKITYKRMYGDFTQNTAEKWRNIVNEFSLTPVQQYTYTTGKNVTDSKMIIDAMDILYSGNVNAVCIMSSDSDFTGLAKRLKESNMFVIGAGERKTPPSFIKACDRFFILEDLREKDEKDEPDTPPVKRAKNKTAEKSEPEESGAPVKKKEVEDLAVKILEEMNGKPCALAALMNKIYQAFPQFNVKNYGAKKAYDFFSKEKFVLGKGKKTDITISLK